MIFFPTPSTDGTTLTKTPTLLVPLLICLATVLPLSAPAMPPLDVSPRARSTNADVAAVTATVNAFYAAERGGNGTRWRALTTPDFYMSHEGELLRNNPGASWEIHIIDLKLDTGGMAAIATLALHNVVDAPPCTGTETASGVRDFPGIAMAKKAPDGRWKIAFLHSTKVPKPRRPRSQNMISNAKAKVASNIGPW